MAAPESLVGRVLDGKYKIVGLLGRGGMGDVYAGTHVQLERAVAVKVLHGDLVSDDSFAARFAREARTAAKLEHPNAVHVYDFGSLENGSAYLVMEFIEGVTLREVIRRNASFPLSVIVDIMRQAAAAIGAAHARGIIHRDVKPENMMVRSGDDGRPVLKVVDFGLAKLLENQTSQLTKGAELIGTPKYMAPEQFSGGRVDERVDIYALGCVLFELLTGHPPYEGTFIEVVGKHVYADIPTVELSRDLAPAIESVVRHALAKDPAERTRSAADLVRELEAACVQPTARVEPDAITIPLPPPGTITNAQLSHAAVEGDAEAFVTRVGDVPKARTLLETQALEPEMIVRQASYAEPATIVLDQHGSDVDPHTRAVRPGRVTAANLGDGMAERRRPWIPIASVAVVGVLAFGSAAYWVAHPSPSAPVPSTPVVPVEKTPEPAPAPSANPSTPAEPTEPAPVEGKNAASSDARKEPDRAHRPPPPPAHSSSKTDARDESDEEVPDVPEPPEAAGVDPSEMPSPAAMRRLRRLAQQIEKQQRIREAKRQRRMANVP